MKVAHPRRKENGEVVWIKDPTVPSPLGCWKDSAAIATVAPDGPLPDMLNGLILAPWKDAPAKKADWEQVAGPAIAEPPFKVSANRHPATGCVVLEPGGRVWVVHPTNSYGEYTVTFPKGRPDPGESLQVAAVRETFEETGLQVRLLSFLVDCDRSTSRSRYYLAERVDGTPAAMGWETQAVSLVPLARLAEVVTHANDAPILAALRAHLPG